MISAGQEDRPWEGIIQRTVAVFWGRSRAFHGDTVPFHVRTADVKDGVNVRLEILTQDLAITIGVTEITIDKQKFDAGYEVALRDAPLRPDDRTFVLRATILGEEDPKNIVSDPSPPLWIDLNPPAFSI